MILTQKYPELFRVEEFPKIHDLFAKVSVLEYPQETQFKESLFNDIVLVNDESLQALANPLFTQKARHVIRNSASLFRLELIVASLMLLGHESFYDDPASVLMKFFKLQHIGQNIITQNHDIKSTQDSAPVIRALAGLLPPSLNQAQTVEISIVLDELISNALFNAPVDHAKKPLFKGRNRGDSFDIPNGHNISAKLASSETHLLMLVKDSFGSLDTQILMKRLKHIYSTNEPPTPRVGLGGAGLGLRMILERAESLYLLSVPTKYTLAGALIPLNKGIKKMFSTPKNIHLGYPNENW